MTIRPSRLVQLFILSFAMQVFIAPPSFAVTNLIQNPGGETGDFTGWTVVNGGDGWAISGDAHEGSYSFIASYEYGTLTQVIDLLEVGYTERFLDSEPVLEFSTYLKGISSGSSTADFYMITVTLLDENDVEITSFETGELTTTAEWAAVSQVFSDYGTGLRSVSVVLSGKDANWWLGNYGPVFDDTSLYFTSEPQSSGSVPFPPSASVTSSDDDDEAIFRDVNDEEAHQSAIEYLHSLGVVEGFAVADSDERDFRPLNEINRAEFLKMTMLLTEEELEEETHCFSDVQDQWFAPYVCTAFKKGIVTGYGDQSFKPEQAITFEEITAIALRAYGFTMTAGDEEAWYEVYLSKASELDVLSNVVTEISKKMLRGDAAQLLYNMAMFFKS